MLEIKYNNRKAKCVNLIRKANGRLLSFSGKYAINNKGELFNLTTQEAGKSFISKQGYPTYTLYFRKTQVQVSLHQLTWQAFNGFIPKGKYINHKDGNKLNTELKNFETVTPKENYAHARKIGLQDKALKSKSQKVQCIETGDIFESATEASNFLGLNPCRVSHAIASTGKAGGFTWKKM